MGIPKKFPTLIGLTLLALILAAFIAVFERGVRLPTSASPAVTPANVEMTNVTDTSFTVSWITDTPATGAVAVSGGSTKNQTAFDERDLSAPTGKLEIYTTHSVTFRKAQPQTNYDVKILSGGKTYGNGDRPYVVQTGPTLSDSVNLEPAYGTVRTFDDQPAAGALVYLTVQGGQKLSTLATANGTWLIPLTLVRTESLSSYIIPLPRMAENLLVRLGRSEASALTDTLNDAPVPQMQLGKTYDFRHQQAQALPPLAQAPTDVLGEASTPAPGAFLVTLVKPGQDTSVPTNLPLVQGTGVPGNTVSITLGIDYPVGGTTIVGDDGIWRYTPAAPLTPGKQSVTITSVDSQGKAVAITHLFEVLKSGTQVLGEATPSATLTPALSATTSPTPTSTLAGQAVPQSGNTIPLVILLILGLGLFTTGAMVFVL